MAFRDTEEFKRGRRGEQVVSELLKACGYYIIPSYDYGGEDGDKAPKLQGAQHGYAVPDLDAAHSGRRRWVEVKTKTHAIEYRKKKELRHGIENRLLEHYREVQRITGCPVDICIYELSSGDILKASIDALGAPVQVVSKWQYGRCEVALWPRDRFMWFGNVSVAGQTVIHEKFGRGIALALRATKGKARAYIAEFASVGMKHVLDAFVTLECGR